MVRLPAASGLFEATDRGPLVHLDRCDHLTAFRILRSASEPYDGAITSSVVFLS